MKIGDLVRVSSNTYIGFGYIKGFDYDDYVLVAFIAGMRTVWVDSDGETSVHDQGYYPRQELTLLKGE